jgi:hypothetical protein
MPPVFLALFKKIRLSPIPATYTTVEEGACTVKKEISSINRGMSSLKGQFHEMVIFFEGLNILISTFCVFAD